MKNRATFGRQLKRMNKKTSLLLFLLVNAFSWASAQTAPGDDFMRSMGKMYVVVAAIVAIFIGIVVFLIYLERKLTKLENQTRSNE
jgi:CcmD family protein